VGGSELADPQASIQSEGFVPRELIRGNRSVGALFELADPREMVRVGSRVGTFEWVEASELRQPSNAEREERAKKKAVAMARAEERQKQLNLGWVWA